MMNWVHNHLDGIYTFLQYVFGFWALYIPTIHKTTKEHKPNMPKWMPNPTVWGVIFIVSGVISFYGAFKKGKLDDFQKDNQYGSIIKDINSKHKQDSTQLMKIHNDDIIALVEMKQTLFQYGVKDSQLNKTISGNNNDIEKYKKEIDAPLMILPSEMYNNPILYPGKNSDSINFLIYYKAHNSDVYSSLYKSVIMKIENDGALSKWDVINDEYLNKSSVLIKDDYRKMHFGFVKKGLSNEFIIYTKVRYFNKDGIEQIPLRKIFLGKINELNSRLFEPLDKACINIENYLKKIKEW